jgi:DNA invertase Pin-like site-specific DNA recombinase
MTIQCAIYTRKSSEEGLEQQFNSLDNQRLAGESYVLSQASEGWEIIDKRYDDGGYSGGNIDRPGLQELFRDIETGLINCVVVYKIDRLTRSLLDFAKIVELFDKHSVSFVAVTQSFNTSNSMGRLMLHVLLSFAQYERELTGERIRDKIAASKKMGYWLGGYPPLGYDAVDKHLKINESEAKNVIYMYGKFLELKSITKLLKDLKQAGIGTRSGNNYSKKTLRQFLENPIYKGFVRHKGVAYKGLHEAIIDEETFEAVQQIFQICQKKEAPRCSLAILKDIIRCGCCDCAMTPTYCYKNNRKYRYYACSNHLRKKSCASENKSIPAGEVEEFVTKAVR